ncbi:MAG: hypothetical protein NPIRA06_32870 [Nitrospirales bacterium]|nr:MAG: hypothetical protein NPIRA06_32870 [Nitrospirales bacterium]
MTVMPLVVLATWLAFTSVESPSLSTPLALPIEPDESTRIDEIYDQEALLLLSLYSLKGNGKADYITGRTVERHVRSTYGNPVYYTLEFPIFYWWNHTMWNDPFVDGVNGNEQVYQEETDFDVSRYKPCVFNGQTC